MLDNYEWFKEKVLTLTKIDLNAYKERQMKRRIDSLISNNKLDSYESYYKLLCTDKNALKKFINYLTINVSEFFRNPEQWDTFQELVVPMAQKKPGKFKIWSAACSTGDEPYTISMIMQKHFSPTKFEIIATDIDNEVLEKAAAGLYSDKSIANLPKEFKKYFEEISSKTFHISDDVKKYVRFKKHNLLTEPYPADCDIIVCRNVLIYFTEDAKNGIYKKFYDALVDGGILFIGNTEQILNPKQFGYTSVKSFFYKK